MLNKLRNVFNDSADPSLAGLTLVAAGVGVFAATHGQPVVAIASFITAAANLLHLSCD